MKMLASMNTSLPRPIASSLMPIFFVHDSPQLGLSDLERAPGLEHETTGFSSPAPNARREVGLERLLDEAAERDFTLCRSPLGRQYQMLVEDSPDLLLHVCLRRSRMSSSPGRVKKSRHLCRLPAQPFSATSYIRAENPESARRIGSWYSPRAV